MIILFMSWVEKREMAIKKGKHLNWVERRALEHANPISLLLLIPAIMFLLTGIWEHDWNYIISGIILVLGGHIYSGLKK